MQVDHNPSPLQTIELQNPKKSRKFYKDLNLQRGKNVIVGEARSVPLKQDKEVLVKKFLKTSSKNLTLRGQGLKRSSKSAKTGLTGPSRGSARLLRNKKEGRPSFEELLAKYKKEGATQK